MERKEDLVLDYIIKKINYKNEKQY